MKSELNFREIGARIQKYRLDKNMTQEELGEIIGTDQKYVSRLEGGHHNTSFSTIVSIAKALNIPIDSFVADYDNSSDESNLYLILDEIRGMNPKQLDILRDFIKIIKKHEIK